MWKANLKSWLFLKSSICRRTKAKIGLQSALAKFDDLVTKAAALEAAKMESEVLANKQAEPSTDHDTNKFGIPQWEHEPNIQHQL